MPGSLATESKELQTAFWLINAGRAARLALEGSAPGISVSGFHALAHLAVHPDGRAPLKTLLPVVGSKANLTDVVGTAERNGWVGRERGLADRRTYDLELTETGQDVLHATRERFTEAATELFDGQDLSTVTELGTLAASFVRSNGGVLVPPSAYRK